jgi:hypothetical protein
MAEAGSPGRGSRSTLRCCPVRPIPGPRRGVPQRAGPAFLQPGICCRCGRRPFCLSLTGQGCSGSCGNSCFLQIGCRPLWPCLWTSLSYRRMHAVAVKNSSRHDLYRAAAWWEALLFLQVVSNRTLRVGRPAVRHRTPDPPTRRWRRRHLHASSPGPCQVEVKRLHVDSRGIKGGCASPVRREVVNIPRDSVTAGTDSGTFSAGEQMNGTA